MLRGYFNSFLTEATGFFRKTALASLLNIWLEDLHESGVDLEEYGRKETELHQQQLTVWNFYGFEYNADGEYTGREGIWFVEEITYGPSPSDWKLEMGCRIEHPTENVKIPGGWIEEDDSGGDKSQMEGDYDSGEVGSEAEQEEQGDDSSGAEGTEVQEEGV